VSYVTDLVAYLQAMPAIAALVGTRIYPLVIPQRDTLPALRYQRIDTPRERSHSGSSHLAHPRIQLSVHALTYAETEAIATVLRTVLDGTAGVPRAGACAIVNEVDDYDPDSNGFLVLSCPTG